tara:strand:- start:70 stop:249 length:180 start_codon:yes stop_codon:yes gene_type:complete
MPRKKTILQRVENILNAFAMWHKKVIRKVRKLLNLTDYKLIWLSFGEGVVVGFIIAVMI